MNTISYFVLAVKFHQYLDCTLGLGEVWVVENAVLDLITWWRVNAQRGRGSTITWGSPFSFLFFCTCLCVVLLLSFWCFLFLVLNKLLIQKNSITLWPVWVKIPGTGRQANKSRPSIVLPKILTMAPLTVLHYWYLTELPKPQVFMP